MLKLGLPAERTTLAGYHSRIAHPLQAFYQHWIVHECCGVVNESTQHLIVPGGRKAKLCADGLFFRTSVFEPLPFKGKNREIALVQSGFIRVVGTGVIH